MKNYTIDANHKKFGRLASEVARILSGKNEVAYAPNKVPDVFVAVKNLKAIDFDAKKMIQNKYYRHSGYIGSLKIKTLGERINEDIRGLFFDCVKGMLPKNKLLDKRIKRLKVEL